MNVFCVIHWNVQNIIGKDEPQNQQRLHQAHGEGNTKADFLRVLCVKPL